MQAAANCGIQALSWSNLQTCLDMIMIENNQDRLQGLAEDVLPVYSSPDLCHTMSFLKASANRSVGCAMPWNELDCLSKEES